MKVVILAGGRGTRFSEETHLRPKPMIEVGHRPMLWHIMKHYARYGFDDFVICAGYRQHMIKEYFADLYLHSSDITFDYTSGERAVEVHGTSVEPWRVTIVDTGYDTNTAGRISRIKEYLGGSRPFLLTYGDGVSDIDLHDLVSYHESQSAAVTITAVQQAQRFGAVEFAPDGKVRAFREKSVNDGNYINGGFMVCEPAVFDYIGRDGADADREDFSKVTLEALAADGLLSAYKYDGFWMCMDTQRDRLRLEELWASGKAPWKTW